MSLFEITIVCLVAIPVVAYVDGIILPKAFKCDFCGAEHRPISWVIPTFLEIVLFLLGIYIGFGLK